MKKIIYPILLISGIWFFASCESKDFLDETETTNLDEITVFSDSTYTTAFLTDIYLSIGFDSDFDRFKDGGYFGTPSGGLQTACDEAEPRQLATTTTDIQFATGTVNPVIINNDSWNRPYENIRKVNLLLKHLPDTPLTEGKIRVYAGEARFLRAWNYSVLLRHYGGFPIIGDTIYRYGDDINSVRNTYEECVNYIVAECNAAEKDLSILPAGRERGRVGAGACKALKARVLLYAASPLFNGSDFAPESHKTLLGYPEYSKERWKLAMEAAQEVISLGVFSLYVDNDEEVGRGFYRQFIPSDWPAEGAYSGIILEKKVSPGQGRERLFQPPSRGGGGGGWAYQELIDAFNMSNGKLITDPDSGYDPQNPYANRDPRFYNTIVFDQTPLRNGATENVPVNIFLGDFNGLPAGQDAVHTGTPTGYYMNKQLHRACAANFFIGVNQARPVLRYAEVLLNFAEAKNEYEGPTAEVYEALESIRERAGMDPFTLPEGLTQDEMRERIRNERRIELAFEGFRFWDVRRWMIAEETENKMMTGMEVIREGSEVTYNRFDVRKHIFRKATYFWPIPYNEVAKAPELIQNPFY